MPLFTSQKMQMVTADMALPGRACGLPLPDRHGALGRDWPDEGRVRQWQAAGKVAYVAMGCFWGAERLFWSQDGVFHTAVGYMAGYTPNPTYDEVCAGQTGHAEAVRICFDPQIIPYESLLRLFWSNHNPTQGMRQGNDVGTQYRSGLYPVNQEQMDLALAGRQLFQDRLRRAGHGAVTTEITLAGAFYHAEPYHQQYLHKVPHGYCGLAGLGIGPD